MSESEQVDKIEIAYKDGLTASFTRDQIPADVLAWMEEE